MEVKILKSTEDAMLIGWEDETGFGQLQIKYDDKGGYLIDAEYISMKKVIEIVKAVAELGNQQVIKLEDDEKGREG